MKKLFLLGACLVALSSTPAVAQTERPAAVVARLYYTGIGTLHVAIARGAGQTEDTIIRSSGNNDHTLAETYQQVLARLYQEGYTLRSTVTTEHIYSVTLLFEKRQ